MADALALGLVLTPAIAAAIAAPVGARIARMLTLATMLVLAAVVVVALPGVAATSGATLAASTTWFALDGAISVFVLLTVLAFPAVLVGAWDAPEMHDGPSVALLLALEATLLGTFLAQDLLVLFVLWEAALLPMLLLIVMHGGAQRVRAALAFFLYTMIGSVPFLAAVLLLGVHAHDATGRWDFSLATLSTLPLSPGTQIFVFASLVLACAIKSPVAPLHGWMPLAYGEAPASATALMAGVLSKMGAFGLLRLAIPLAPVAAARYAPAAVALGVFSLLYGAIVALRQERPRMLVAYASLSHMGYVVVGAFTLTAAGTHGAHLQVLSHGFAVTGLFLLVGALERRSGDDASGVVALAARAPRLAVTLMLFVLASLALPMTSGFSAEFLVLAGAFERGLTDLDAGRTAPLVAAVLACGGVVLGATYMLRFARARLYGVANATAPRFPDLDGRELAACGALFGAVLWLGLWPAAEMRLVQPAVDRIVAAAPAASRQPTTPATHALAAVSEPPTTGAARVE